MIAINQEFAPDKPPKHVLDWCENLVRAAAQNAVWGIPRSGTVFRIDKENKKLILITPGKDDSDFYATKRVFSFIGWDVIRE